MKTICLLFLVVFLGSILVIGVEPAHAQDASPTPTAIASPMPAPSATPEPVDGGRPQIIVAEYRASEEPVHAGNDFDLEIRFRNNGTQTAQNLTIVFAGDNFYLRQTGGVWSTPSLIAGDSFSIRQPLTASWSLAGYTMGATTITTYYTSENGTAYSDTFLISVPIYFDTNWGKPTPTPVLGENPQVVVQGYTSDRAELKPGDTFTLELELANLGSQLAKGVRMVIARSATTNVDGSPSSGAAVSSNPFAPLDSSNMVYVGDLMPGETSRLTQRLIVDLQASTGVYTLPLVFQYSDDKGQQRVDAQSITLIVHTTPQLKIAFYENPGDLQAGTSSILPIQVTNMGYQMALLGDLRLTTSQGTLTGDMVFIGSLESGGSFTHDAEIVPGAPGDLEIQVVVDYNDGFGKTQNIVQTLKIRAAGDTNPAFATPTPEVENIVNSQEDTFWQKLVQFFKTILGLRG
jgi:hypothetical protein